MALRTKPSTAVALRLGDASSAITIGLCDCSSSITLRLRDGSPSVALGLGDGPPTVTIRLRNASSAIAVRLGNTSSGVAIGLGDASSSIPFRLGNTSSAVTLWLSDCPRIDFAPLRGFGLVFIAHFGTPCIDYDGGNRDRLHDWAALRHIVQVDTSAVDLLGRGSCLDGLLISALIAHVQRRRDTHLTDWDRSCDNKERKGNHQEDDAAEHDDG